MTTITFDTHAAVKRLLKSDFSQDQAEALVETFKEAHGQLDLATKQDLAELETRIVKWVGAWALVQIALLASILVR